LKEIWAKQFGSTVPRTVAFAKNSWDVVVLGLFDGMVFVSTSIRKLLLTIIQAPDRRRRGFKRSNGQQATDAKNVSKMIVMRIYH
jgi:hypothetical protein